MAETTNKTSIVKAKKLPVKPATAQQQINSLRSKTNTLIFIWVLTVIVAAAGIYYLLPLPAKLLIADNEITELTTKLAKLENSISSVKKNVSSTLKSVSDLLKISNNPALDEVIPIITDAVWLLEIKLKPRVAANLLQQAALILHAANDPQNITQQNALSQAAQDLLNIPPVATKQVLRDLSALSTKVGTLTLPKLTPNQDTSKPVNVNPKTTNNLANNIWLDIKNLIKVSHSDNEAMSRLISKEAKSMAYMLINLQLKYIHLAAVSVDQQLFVAEINHTINLITTLFDSQQSNTKQFINSLHQLSQQSIQLAPTPASMLLVKDIIK